MSIFKKKGPSEPTIPLEVLVRNNYSLISIQTTKAAMTIYSKPETMAEFVTILRAFIAQIPWTDAESEYASKKNGELLKTPGYA